MSGDAALTTSVVLTAPGDFDGGLRRLVVFGDPEGFAERMAANDGGPFRVERVVRDGKRATVWLNPLTIAYFSAGPPLGELGTPT